MDFQVNGTLIQQYYICKREVWLTARNLSGDQDNENLQIGKIIAEFTYKRNNKEVDIGGSKIDLIKIEDGELVVGEVKKSSRFLESAEKQLLFYLLQLKEMGIKARGELLIPEEKEKITVDLNPGSEEEIRAAMADIERIVNQQLPPPAVKIKYCRNCAYSEFCWA